MKKLFYILLLLVTFAAVAAPPPVLRNSATTNAAALSHIATNGPDGSRVVSRDAISRGGVPMPVGWTHTNATWVDVTNGVDAAGRGTFALPYASIQSAATNSPPGSVVIVKPGIYVESVKTDWGQKDYILSADAVIVGATNQGGASTYFAVGRSSGGSSVLVTNNYPVRILGRGKIISGNDSVPTFLVDNGDLEVEAELIENPDHTGYVMELQGDVFDGQDATQTVTIRNSIIAGQIHINPYAVERKSFTLLNLKNCSFLTTNEVPIFYDGGNGANEVSFKVVLEGVESRSPQTNFFNSEGYGSRIFGDLLVLTNLPGVTSTGAYVQRFNDVVFAGQLTGNGRGVTNIGGVKVYRALLTQTGTGAPTASVQENSLGTLTYSYSSAGVYTVNSSSLFVAGKTFVDFKVSDTTGTVVSSFYSATASQIALRTFEELAVPANDLMAGDGFLEILVYP
jgi:hypothetical protein